MMNDGDFPNPYSPPSTNQSDRTPKLRTDFGFRLAWSLFWRVFLLQGFAVWGISAIDLVSVDAGSLKQVTICGALAMVTAMSLLFTRRGALFFLFGDRIALADSAWRKFHWLLVEYYGAMAVWNVIVRYVLVDVSANIRIAVSLVSLFFFFAIVPRLLRSDEGKA